MGMPRRTKGERLQMIHPKAKARSECKGKEAKHRRQTNKEVDNRLCSWVKADLEEKRSVVTLPMLPMRGAQARFSTNRLG